MGEPAIRERIVVCSGWRVQRQLGRGQYGTAYLVEWSGRPADDAANGAGGGAETQLGELAVAKVVGLEFLPEKEHKLAFQEVELMRNLKHPHIVALKDHFMTENGLELVIVMEFCDGGDLRGEVKSRSTTKPPSHIPEAQIMTWFVQLTLALNYMHQRHILHRDLKTSNIFLTANNTEGRDVRLGDFGISRVLEGTVDVAATVVGTPYYMSPEVCRAEPYGFKSDIWALGCVLYEMCMLKHAFESQSLLGLVYKIVSEAYDPIPQQYSAELRTLIDRVLDKSHYSRPSGKDLVADPYVRKFDKSWSSANAGVEASQHGGTLPNGTGRAPPGRPQSQQGHQPLTQQGPPPRASLAQMKASMPQKRPEIGGGIVDGARLPEPSPMPPVTGAVPAQAEEQPVRREWCAPPFVAAGKPPEEGELRAKLLLSRMRRQLAMRRQNWLQVFASFDQKGNGQLKEAEFERAVTSMALGLSDQEIREVRVHLQGSGACLAVDQFGGALHSLPQEVAAVEEWGRQILLELAREASKVGVPSGGVGPGASVRIQGLQSAAGLKLNGCEGVVEKWDAGTCRWQVKLTDGVSKSIRNENLQVLRPASASSAAAAAASAAQSSANGVPDTAPLYRLLCEGGETAVDEDHFLAIVQRFVPKLDAAQSRRLLLLQPKSPEGRVDVPEMLQQLVMPIPGDQTIGPGGPGLLPRQRLQQKARGTPLVPGPDLRPPTAGASLQPRWAAPATQAKASGPFSPSRVPVSVPGSVPSPRSAGAATAAANTPSPLGGGGGGSAPSAGPNRVHAEVALLRLAQRLKGRPAAPGPGLDVLRLFAMQAEELRLEELLDAVSVLPLGISRAEVQIVFAHVREGWPGGNLQPGVLLLEQLTAAAEAMLIQGVPPEAAVLERIDLSRLPAALQRLSASAKGGRASPQEFRVTLMQAEPYLTHSQLEWLMLLTDKDGEGHLLPFSLLARLGGGGTPMHLAPPGSLPVPPNLVAPAHTGPVAPTAPRSLVVTAALVRVRARLLAAGPQLLLDRILGLFDIGAGRDGGVSRDVLALLLGHLRLGISVAEAYEVVAFLASGGGGRTPSADNTIQLTSLFAALQRAGEAEAESLVGQLREAARMRLLGRGHAFLMVWGSDVGEWLPEPEFRRCLALALQQDDVQTPASAVLTGEEEEDRLLLLSERNAAGDVRWRAFAEAFAGLQDIDIISDVGDRQWRTLMSPKNVNGYTRLDKPDATTSQQSWRTLKTAQVSSQRTLVTPLHQVAEPEPARGRGLCPCRRSRDA